MSKQIRFDLELNEQDNKKLDELIELTNRNRKNLAETIVRIALQSISEGKTEVDLNKLGFIKPLKNT